MIEIKHYIKFSIFILILLVLQGCSKTVETTTPPRIKIMVNAPDGALVESENPIYINSGGTAQFALTINEGFKLENIETIGSSVNALTGNNDNSCAVFYENGYCVLKTYFIRLRSD